MKQANKWTVKDVITTVLLTVLLIVIQMVVNMVCMASFSRTEEGDCYRVWEAVRRKRSV